MNRVRPMAVWVVALVVAVMCAPAHASARPGPRLEVGATRVGSMTAPLSVSVQAPRRAELSLRVNGERAHDAFDFGGRRIHTAHLSGTDGLQSGRNRLRITAESAGHSTTRTLTVRVPRRALYADAGNDVGMTAGAPTQIGVSPAGPSATPGLHRRWRIVHGPDANATLAHRHESQPVIETSTPGTYVLRLRVRREGDRGASYDTVTVPVSPPDPPIGAPINTLGPDGAITIAGSSYGGSSDDKSIAYVVLERTTRAVALDDQGNPVAGNVDGDANGIAKLAGIANQYASASNSLRYLMVVSGRHSPGASTQSIQLFRKIGVPVLDQQFISALSQGWTVPFSVIGIPGAPPGGATYRIPAQGAVNPSGALDGYLQKNQAVDGDGTPLYDYASSEHPAFDTRTGTSSTENTMTVGGATYSAGLTDVAGATAGLHIVLLDGQTLQPLVNHALVTNANNSTITDRKLQAGAADHLRGWLRSHEDQVVLVQTIGKPKAAGPEWQAIVDLLARAGANRQLVNALDGTTEYALVGRLDSQQPPAEASTAYDHGPYPPPRNPPARLIGTLARDRASTFAAQASSAPTQATGDKLASAELARVAYQSPEAWRQIDPKAENYICKQLDFCQDVSSCPDLRSCYWQKYSLKWGTEAQELSDTVHYPDQGQPGFSPDEFNDAKDELIKEMLAVGIVQDYIAKLQEPFTAVKGRAPVDLQVIGDKIYKAVQPPPNDNTTSFVLGLVSKTLLVGQAAGPPASAAIAGVSAVFGLASYLSNKQGQPILGTEITATSAALRKQLFDRYDLASRELTAIGLILVSDYGKLMAAKHHIKSNWTLPADMTTAEESMSTAAEQYFYEELMPVAYPFLIHGDANNARNLNCKEPGHEGWPNQPDDAQMQATVGYDEQGKPIKNIFFFTRGIWGASSPPAGLADDIFRPRGGQNPGLGVEKLSFFTPAVFGGQSMQAVNNTFRCRVGFLPEWP
jgi:hypothetical protein